MQPCIMGEHAPACLLQPQCCALWLPPITTQSQSPGFVVVSLQQSYSITPVQIIHAQVQRANRLCPVSPHASPIHQTQNPGPCAIIFGRFTLTHPSSASASITLLPSPHGRLLYTCTTAPLQHSRCAITAADQQCSNLSQLLQPTACSAAPCTAAATQHTRVKHCSQACKTSQRINTGCNTIIPASSTAAPCSTPQLQAQPPHLACSAPHAVTSHVI
jgi:hypothetical protein